MLRLVSSSSTSKDDILTVPGHQEREQLDDESMRKLPFELGKKPSQTQKSTERSKKRKGDGDDKPAAKKKTKRSHTDQKAALTTAKPIKSSIICGVDFGTTHSGRRSINV